MLIVPLDPEVDAPISDGLVHRLPPRKEHVGVNLPVGYRYPDTAQYVVQGHISVSILHPHVCSNVLQPAYCLVDGNCYAHGDSNPNNATAHRWLARSGLSLSTRLTVAMSPRATAA